MSLKRRPATRPRVIDSATGRIGQRRRRQSRIARQAKRVRMSSASMPPRCRRALGTVAVHLWRVCTETETPTRGRRRHVDPMDHQDQKRGGAGRPAPPLGLRLAVSALLPAARLSSPGLDRTLLRSGDQPIAYEVPRHVGDTGHVLAVVLPPGCRAARA